MEKSSSIGIKSVVLTLRTIFWLAVGGLPIAIDHVVTAFMLNGCMPGSQCLTHAMPLIVDIGLVGWFARALLWPLAAWFLGGRWLFMYYQTRSRRTGARAN
jgi:hypothetical protein